MKSGCAIRLESLPGDSLKWVALDMEEMALRLQVPVRVRFNGVELFAKPGATAESLLEMYEKRIAAILKAEEEAQR